MLSYKSVFLALAYLSLSVSALPIRIAREVPQEHSHEPILTSVRASLNKNNVDGVQDVVFALLGNAAAITGAGKITDPDCLQQAVADQAFTNAKAAGDVQGQVDALTFRALERNSGSVGAVSGLCKSITAKNPEIAAITQHQDPASPNAAANNKAVVLALAQQIHAVGGDPLDALLSGTFAPGTIGDPTAKGNTCDDANDPNGCINTLKLLVKDATEDEINAAVAGGAAGGAVAVTASSTAEAAAAATDAAAATCPPPTTVTVTAGSKATAVAAASKTAAAAGAATVTAAASGAAINKFTGALGGIAPVTIETGGKGFVVNGDDFINLSAAAGRACDVQHNLCANNANSAAGRAAGISASDCDTQNTACHTANGI